MTHQPLSRASPTDKGTSIAYQAMADAAAYYLANGGVAVAKMEVTKLNEDLSFYDDHKEAFSLVMARIKEAEDEEKLRMLARAMEMMMPSASKSVKHERQPKGELLPKLSTPEAMLMWQRLQAAGYIDENYQPVNLSRPLMAVLADELMAHLSTENERLMGMSSKWTYFETLWGTSNMRVDHHHALDRKNASEFRDKIKKILDSG